MDLWVIEDTRPWAPFGETWLSPQEDERARQYAWSTPRLQFTGSHAVLRYILASYLDTMPGDLSFYRTACAACGRRHGKPALTNGGDLTFSLSRSGYVCAVAVSEGRQLGVDVEGGNRASDWIARPMPVAGALSAVEAMFPWPTDPAERGKAFLRLWTAKEARLKASGLGFAVEPNRLTVPLQALERSAGPISWDRWRLWTYESDWIAAIVTVQSLGREPNVHLRKLGSVITRLNLAEAKPSSHLRRTLT